MYRYMMLLYGPVPTKTEIADFNDISVQILRGMR